MRCLRVQSQLPLHVGGDTTSRQARRIENHLAVCSACRERASQLSRDLTALRELGETSRDEWRTLSVREEVLRAGAQHKPWHPLPGSAGARRWALAAAGVACAVLLVLLFALERRAPTSPPVIAERATTPRALPTPGDEDQSVPGEGPAEATAAAPAVEPAPEAAPVAPEVRRPVLPSRPEPTAPLRAADASGERMVMKLLTDDPDVVIYWIVETKGEKNHEEKRG